MKRFRDKRYVKFRRGISLKHGCHLRGLMYDHRDYEITEHREEKRHLKQRHKRRYDPPAEPEQLAVELDERFQHISYKAAHTERKKHTLKHIHQPYYADKYHTIYNKPDRPVKVIWLLI